MPSSVLRLGPLPEQATATMILVHGRGASAESILSLYPEMGEPRLAALAPQAAGFTWYPNSFLAPLTSNQPYLDRALAQLQSLVEELAERGVSSERVVLLGFSQGACLVSEFAARNPRRYGGVVGLIGGLIGPPATPRDYTGALEGTPVFLGCSDPDPHVPFARVLETEQVLSRMGAAVEVRRYPGAGHTVVPDQLDAVRALVKGVVQKFSKVT